MKGDEFLRRGMYRMYVMEMCVLSNALMVFVLSLNLDHGMFIDTFWLKLSLSDQKLD